MKRKWIEDDIVSSFYYRDVSGNPLYTMSVGFLFSYEKEYIQQKYGFGIREIYSGMNQIVFRQNIK